VFKSILSTLAMMVGAGAFMIASVFAVEWIKPRVPDMPEMPRIVLTVDGESYHISGPW
jgi:hypothetical protein